MNVLQMYQKKIICVLHYNKVSFVKKYQSRVGYHYNSIYIYFDPWFLVLYLKQGDTGRNTLVSCSYNIENMQRNDFIHKSKYEIIFCEL